MDPNPLRATIGHSLPEAHGDGAWACFSPCGRYRWLLGRCWQPGAPALLFIGLNPSCADGRTDDPTLRRLQRFARAWGFGAVEVLNLFARISPDPRALRRCADPVGPAADGWIRSRIQHHQALQGGPLPLWLGWGNGGALLGRDRQLLTGLADLQLRLLCLGTTILGQPRHPLYVRGDCCLRPFAPSWGQRPEPSALPCPAPLAASPST